MRDAPIPSGVHADELCPRGSHDHCDAIWIALSACYAVVTLAPDQTADGPDVGQGRTSEPQEHATPGQDGQVGLEAFGGAD